ncbi:MAG TPA: membrane protein insertase YidC [Bryobacteraceae bacterium]|jgi:YidC/Oxa1 family membrane protein insertase|nr:membrane protein insertase YidC [Bryobacteraceae bacterium]
MPNNLSGGASEPPSLEKRLPIALGLMMLVLLVSQYLFKPPQPPKTAKAPAEKQAVVQPRQVPAAVDIPATASAGAAGQITAATEQITDIDTDLYHLVFTNRGGLVKSWVLKRYADTAGKPLQLVHQTAFGEQSTNVPLPFAIEIKDQRITVDPNTVLYKVTPTSGGMGVDYSYSDGHTSIQKSFGFSKDSYLANVHSAVVTNGTPVAHFLEWRGGFGDPKAFRAASNGRTVRYDATAGKLIEKTVKDAKDGATTDGGNYTFGGVEDNFFAAVALPASGSLEVRTYSDPLKVPGEDKPQPSIGGGLSTGAENEFTLFVGPKDLNILKKVNPKLTQIIDWGFFGILAKPLFLWLNWTADHWTGNYGWAIVVVTLIINLVLFPLKFSSLRSARKMQRLQPQIKAINERYKNIKINDPKKAEQNQEVMALYKKGGVNPVGGCLPLLIQMPFLYAFYRVLSIAIELRHAPWLWVSDLSAPETIAIHILPVVLVITQFLTQRMTPSPGVDPNQQKMMLFMPLVFGYIFWFLSSGLVLYYLTSNLVGIAQQLVINRFMPAPPVEAPAKAPVKKVSRK